MRGVMSVTIGYKSDKNASDDCTSVWVTLLSWPLTRHPGGSARCGMNFSSLSGSAFCDCRWNAWTSARTVPTSGFGSTAYLGWCAISPPVQGSRHEHHHNGAVATHSAAAGEPEDHRHTGRHAAMPARVDITLVKALARAFRWRKLLEAGRYATIDELASAEKINASYVSRILRLTLLAPEIVDVVLHGRQALEMMLPVDAPGVDGAFPVEWERQCWRLVREIPSTEQSTQAPPLCRQCRAAAT